MKLTPEVMERYINGTLSDREMHQVEELLLESEFEAEAMEGLEQLPDGVLNSDLSVLQDRLDRRLRPQRKITWWAYAAVFVLVLSATILIINNSGVNEQPSQISMDTSEEPESERKEVVAEAKEEPAAPGDQGNDATTDEETFVEEIPVETVQEPVRKTAPVDKTEGDYLAEIELADDSQAVTLNPVPRQDAQAFISPPLPQAEIQAAEQELYGIIKGEDIHVNSSSVGGSLHGRVVDNKGMPIQGANIYLKGTRQGTITNRAGEFELDVSQLREKNLIVSRLGMETQEMKVPSKDSLTIVLDEDAALLNETIISRDALLADGRVGAAPLSGMDTFESYVKANLKFPAGQNEEGDVIVIFTVNPDGSLSDFQIERTPGEEYSKEAVRLISEGPVWGPATYNGSPFTDRVKLRIPFLKAGR